MKIFSPRFYRRAKPLGRKQRGTSLLELMVAISVFMIVSGSAFTLFQQQQNSQLTLNGQVGLNLALRSTLSQLQMDVINGGNGYYQNANIPSWPVGVTIVNTMSTTGTACNTGTTYGPTCFDQINVLVAANSTTYPPVNPITTANFITSSNPGVGYVQVPSGFTQAQTVSAFSAGDELLLVKGTGTPQIAAVVLTANGSPSGSSAVELQFHPTDTYGLNTITPDWLDISACDGIYTEATSTTCNSLLNPTWYSTPRFITTFTSSDWIIKLAPISYQVCAGPGSPTVPYPCDQTSTSPDIADPKLIRTQSGNSTMMMDQIVGFRVGAFLYNSPASGCQYESNDVLCNYQYVASQYTTTSNGTTSASDPYNFSLVRAIRVSLIGRTLPNYRTAHAGGPYLTPTNSFDGGPYLVQGTAAVINPRNMSMNDNGLTPP